MRILFLILRALAFILLLGLAIKNDGLVTVKAYFDTSWQLPLVVVILGTFALGVVTGLLAMLSSAHALRRENDRLQKLAPKPAPSTRLPAEADRSPD